MRESRFCFKPTFAVPKRQNRPSFVDKGCINSKHTHSQPAHQEPNWSGCQSIETTFSPTVAITVGELNKQPPWQWIYETKRSNNQTKDKKRSSHSRGTKKVQVFRRGNWKEMNKKILMKNYFKMKRSSVTIIICVWIRTKVEKIDDW